jgi:hypothetical protein
MRSIFGDRWFNPHRDAGKGKLLLRAVGADAVGRFGRQVRAEELLDRKPVTVVFDPSAPTAEAQEFLELVEPAHQLARHQVDAAPDEEDEQTAEQRTRPAHDGGFAEKQMRQVDEFSDPHAHDEKRETERLAAENGTAGFWSHGYGMKVDENQTRKAAKKSREWDEGISDSRKSRSPVGSTQFVSRLGPATKVLAVTLARALQMGSHVAEKVFANASNKKTKP